MPHDLEHPWMIVAPWWKWKSPTDIASGRVTAPVFQKYDSANLVNEFLKNPQRCLKRIAEDYVHVAKPGTFKTDLLGRPRRFGNVSQTGLEVFDDVEEDPRTFKVFLDTHKRFYLIVCQVHCDSPGFPKIVRDGICEVGFVVRRRLTGKEEDPAVVQARKAVCATRDALRDLDTKLARERTYHATAPNGRRVLMAEQRVSAIVKQRAFAAERLAAEQDALKQAVLRFGADQVHLQGWFSHLAPINAAQSPATVIGATPIDNVGIWCDVDEEPNDIGDESHFPLYPLIPPQRETRHAGQFGTIYFGLLPTGGRETDPAGRPRFDDRTQYEVRCFVKRHHKPHAKGSPCPCPDRIFWSLPTEPYKLASHFDLIGTSHQPVTIQLPDLKELAAQAKPLPGIAFAMPKGYPMVTGDKDGKPQPLDAAPGFQICTFPIPLITIVAKFVFEIFLPVVMFMFGLFWMLKLKFCIPPEIEVAGGISAKADVEGRFGIDAAADFEATLDIGGGVTLADAVKNDIDANFNPIAGELNADWSAIALANMELDVRDAGLKPPDVTASLELEAEVSHT